MPEQIKLDELICPFRHNGLTDDFCLGVKCALAVPFVTPEGETFARCSIFILATLPMQQQQQQSTIKPAIISRFH